MGDPGLLCDLLVPAALVRNKEFAVGIIPHYVDQDNPLLLDFIRKTPGTKLLVVFSETRDFISQVAKCEVVLSSSLHGLIAADSLGVPNAWLRLSDKVWGNDFKFSDYYSVYGLENIEPFTFNAETTRQDVLRLPDDYRRPGLAQIKKALLDSFPFKK